MTACSLLLMASLVSCGPQIHPDPGEPFQAASEAWVRVYGVVDGKTVISGNKVRVDIKDWVVKFPDRLPE